MPRLAFSACLLVAACKQVGSPVAVSAVTVTAIADSGGAVGGNTFGAVAGSDGGGGAGSSPSGGGGTSDLASHSATLHFSDISALVTADCGGGSCHGQGAGQTVYDGNEPGFDGDAPNIVTEINSGGMPPSGAMPPADKQEILAYAKQVVAQGGSGSGVGSGVSGTGLGPTSTGVAGPSGLSGSGN